MKLARTWLGILVFLLVLANFSGFIYFYNGFQDKDNFELANITRIIDGDTIETSMGDIRLLDINTPEKGKAGYEEAKDFLAYLEGSEVELYGSEDDKYERKLRYVFYEGKLVNEEIAGNGLGTLYYYDKTKYTSEIERAEKRAREMEVGLWEKSSDECGSCIKLEEIENNPEGECEAEAEYIKLKNSCNFDCNLQGWEIKDDANHFYKLTQIISSGNELVIRSSKIIKGCGGVWNDDRDSLYLRDESGKLVLFYRY
ncbi:MAG: thermonuclease family protein [archaeon]